MRNNNLSFILTCFLCTVTAMGCGGIGSRLVRAYYSSALVEVDRQETTKEHYGSEVTIKPGPDKSFVYEDGLFNGQFYVTSSRINFTLTNKTDRSIKIIWDEAAFIDMEGQSGRVTHEGVKYIDRNASQPPSVVPSEKSLTDFVVPTERVYYREGYYSQYFSTPGGWEESSLILPGSRNIISGDSAAVNAWTKEIVVNKGKRFGLLLPLEIEGIVNEYTFWFEVQDVSVGP